MRELPCERRRGCRVQVTGGSRAVGGHTLTNRHSFITGVSNADNLHARASLGRALCCSIKGGGTSRGRSIKERAMILAKTRKLLAAVAAATIILPFALPHAPPEPPPNPIPIPPPITPPFPP